MKVRHATVDDRDTLEAFAYWLDLDHQARGERTILPELRAAVAFGLERSLPIMVAEDDRGEVGGMVLWLPLSPAKGEVTCFGTYVVPAWRGEHVSTLLRERATEEWQKRGATSFVGSVVRGNTIGMRSMLAAGFHVSGFIMRKEIGDGKELPAGERRQVDADGQRRQEGHGRQGLRHEDVRVT